MDSKNPDESLKARKLMGLQILSGFRYAGDETWEAGKIYDPKNGKTYSCKMRLEGENLKIRGFIGISLLGRTTVWSRKVYNTFLPPLRRTMKKLTHLDRQGRAKMVDVTGKPVTEREAVARGSVSMKRETLKLIADGKVPKGDVICVARIAGIMAAKRTSTLIPMCHPLMITSIDVSLHIDRRRNKIDIEVNVKTAGQTGVEMEALTAVSAAALTVYDMCKAVDRDMVISDIMLIEKRGGKSGVYKRK